MGDVNLEIKLSNLDERVIKIEESGGGSGGDGYITSVSNDFNVVNKKLSLSNDITTKLPKSVPTTSDAGKVARVQSDGTVDWETPSASITEPTELEKGIIGGDEYNSTTTYAFNDTTKPNSCIKDNKIYTVKSNVTAFSNIEPTVTSGWEEYWEETSIAKINFRTKKISGIIPHTSLITSGDIYYSKQLDIVSISFSGKTTSMNAGWSTLSNANPYPPKSRLVITTNVNKGITDVAFDADGNIQIYPYDGVAIGNTVTFNATYFI